MFIKGRFTTMNEYIKAERSDKYWAASIKKRETNLARVQVLGKKIETPCKLKMTWYRKSKSGSNFDLDGVVGVAKKHVLDGLVKANVIPNDNYTHIKGFIDEYVESKDEGVKIERVEE